MNIHTRKLESEISESEVNEALAVLQKWRDQGGELDLSDEKCIPPQVASLWKRYLWPRATGPKLRFSVARTG